MNNIMVYELGQNIVLRKVERKNQKEDTNKWGEGCVLSDQHKLMLFCLL